jgi:hypothetical protein
MTRPQVETMVTIVTMVVVETGRCFIRGSFRSVSSAWNHYSQGLQLPVHAVCEIWSTVLIFDKVEAGPF